MKFIDENCVNKLLLPQDLRSSLCLVQKFLDEFYKFLNPLENRIQNSLPDYNIKVFQHPTDTGINLFTRTMVLKIIVSVEFSQGNPVFHHTEDIVIIQEGVTIVIHITVPINPENSKHQELIRIIKDLINKGGINGILL